MSNLSKMLNQILQHSTRILDAEAGGVIYLCSYGDDRIALAQSNANQLAYATLEQLCRHTCLNSEALLLDDQSLPAEGVIPLAKTPLTAALIAPVIWENKLYGAIGFASIRRGRSFNSHEFELAHFFASQAALAIHNFQIQATGNGTSYSVASELLASTDIKHMMYIVARETINNTQAQDVHIHLYDADADQLTLGLTLWAPTGQVDRYIAPARRDGFTAAVARTGTRLLIKDLSRHPYFANMPPASSEVKQYHMILGLPFKQQGRVIGVLNAFFDEEPDPEQIHFFDNLEAYAGAAFEKGKLFQTERLYHAQSDVLLHAARAVSSTLNLEHVLQSILKESAALLPCYAGAILGYDSQNLSKAFVQVGKEGNPSPLELDSAEAFTFFSHVRSSHAATARCFTLPNTDTVYIPGTENIQSWIVVRLVLGYASEGILLIGHTERDIYSIENLVAAERLAVHAGTAIENALLYQTVRAQADYLETQIEKRAAQVVREREMLQALVESAGEGIIFTRADGTIEFVNPAWKRISGYRAREVIGKSLVEIFPDASTVLQEALMLLKKGDSWKGEIEVSRPDGSVYDAALTLTEILEKDGSIGHIVGIFSDVTAQKQIDTMRREFISNVSHELRTPLTGLKLYHTLLHRANLPEASFEYLNVMEGELKRLERLVEDLLDIARLEHSSLSLKLQVVDLNRILDNAFHIHTTHAIEQGLTINVTLTDEILLVNVDRDRILQVVGNLAANAINHTPTGGTVGVCTFVELRNNIPMVGFTIWDTGSGIRPDDLPFIFERFFRSDDSKNKRIAGTGLGLSIVKEIVGLHDGEILVESIPMKGSQFTVYLPLVTD
jgi:PAS domain S-box-containing protein